MTIDKQLKGKTLIITLSGRLDSTTSPMLVEEIKDLDGVNRLLFDLEKLDYLSSSGLRFFLGAQQRMDEKGGNLTIVNVGENVLDIFDDTGFTSVLSITDVR